jgi:hypothetical protein
MRARLAAAAVLALGACNAPDYTPVRDWARSASIAADYPSAAQGAPAPADDGILAMQEALVVWLSALGRMADDGVLPYPEDPFRDLAPRAAAADPRGGEAVAALGRTLRHATRNNLRAPALRDTIRGTDAQVQALVAALSAAVTHAQAPEAEPAAPPPVAPRGRAGRAAAPPPAAPPEPAVPPAATARARYVALLAQVAQGHALLKEKAGSITREETVGRIRAAEDQLRRAARTLPLPSIPLRPAGAP